jgi:hypothetical protein
MSHCDDNYGWFVFFFFGRYNYNFLHSSILLKHLVPWYHLVTLIHFISFPRSWTPCQLLKRALASTLRALCATQKSRALNQFYNLSSMSLHLSRLDSVGMWLKAIEACRFCITNFVFYLVLSTPFPFPDDVFSVG